MSFPAINGETDGPSNDSVDVKGYRNGLKSFVLNFFDCICNLKVSYSVYRACFSERERKWREELDEQLEKVRGRFCYPICELEEQIEKMRETEKKKIEPKYSGKGDKKGVEVSQPQNTSGSTNISMDRLREELTCAMQICLEICFEPSTTPCGHSFCSECLRSAADICGNRCPKCRKFISKRRSCTVNTVLWNTIQLLFPDVVEGRKAAAALNSGETHYRSAIRTDSHSNISTSRTNMLRTSHGPGRHRSQSTQSFTPAEMLRISGEFSSMIWTDVGWR